MRIFPPPVAKKRARANSFPRDRPRTLVGGRAAVDLRRKQNLKRNDRKTLSPSPFPSLDSVEMTTRLDSVRSFVHSFVIATLVRSPVLSRDVVHIEHVERRNGDYRLSSMSSLPSIRSERCKLHFVDATPSRVFYLYVHIYRRAMRFAPVRKSCLSSSIVDTDTMEGKRKKPISGFDRYQPERVDENN